MITIELFGVPRMRAERDSVVVDADSLGEAFRALGLACPALDPTVIHEGRLRSHYLVAVNGLQLTADPATPLCEGDVVVLVSAEAGG